MYSVSRGLRLCFINLCGLTGLDTGVVFVRRSENSSWDYIVVAGGFALVNKNKLTILVNEAELGSV